MWITYVFLLSLSQVIGQEDGVAFVDFCRNFIESSDESMLDPIHQEFDGHYHQTVWGQIPEALFAKKYKKKSISLVLAKCIL